MNKEWKPLKVEQGWRAAYDDMIDGRVWDTEELCKAYIEGVGVGFSRGVRSARVAKALDNVIQNLEHADPDSWRRMRAIVNDLKDELEGRGSK